MQMFEVKAVQSLIYNLQFQYAFAVMYFQYQTESTDQVDMTGLL